MKLSTDFITMVLVLSLSCFVFAGEYEFEICTPVESGKGVYSFLKPVEEDTFSLFLDVEFEKYPPGTACNPAFEASLIKPVTTSRIRLVVNDQSAHITEIRLFGPETKDYPPATWGKTVGIEAPNLATGAEITASGKYEGRPKEAVIDGMMTFSSRWYSGMGNKPPHWLVIDMGIEKVVNHIQMVSGYRSQRSVEWKAIARNFHFECWKDGEWEKLQIVESELQQAGSFGIIIEGEQGQNLFFLHDNDKAERFAAGTFIKGKLKVLERFAPEGIEEPQKGIDVRMEVKKSGDYYHLFCNGQKVASFDSEKHNTRVNGPYKISFSALSRDTVYDIKKAGIQKINDNENSYLSNIIIRDVQNDRIVSSDFDPFAEKVLSVLPNITDEVSIELQHSKSQKVFINNKPTNTLDLNKARIEKADPIEIRVVSKNDSRKYTLEVVPVPPSGRLRLAYKDEFDKGRLNLNDWIYRRGLRWESLNTPEAVSVKDGKLRIELSVKDGQQRVGGIISKKVYGYGYYETSAKLTDARGWHSAFWNHGLQTGMPEMGTTAPEMNGNYTEIDCFESTTGNAFSTNLHHNMHHLAGTGKMHSASVADGFHTFSWLWTPKEVCYYFDGKLVDRRINIPPTRPQNVWLTCVAHPDAETKDLPKEILFEYFRYYEFETQPDKLPERAIIVAGDSSGYTEKGKWESAPEDKAQSYRLETITRKTTTKGSSCSWSARLPKTGLYEVFVWNPYIVIDPVINERKYEVLTSEGVKTAYYNPRVTGQSWVSLGTYNFNQNASVTLKAEKDELYRSDAVAFVTINGRNR